MTKNAAARNVVSAALLWWSTRERWIASGGSAQEDELNDLLTTAESMLAEAVQAYRRAAQESS